MTDITKPDHSGKWQLSLREQEARVAHREWIGGRVITLLSHYWREDDDDALIGAIAADWADVLEGIPREYVQRACKRYLMDEPRRKPTPGAILALARQAMPAPKAVATNVPVEPERVTCDPDVANEIMKKAGFLPRKFGGDE